MRARAAVASLRSVVGFHERTVPCDRGARGNAGRPSNHDRAALSHTSPTEEGGICHERELSATDIDAGAPPHEAAAHRIA
jgi:hypothetical protein